MVWTITLWALHNIPIRNESRKYLKINFYFFAKAGNSCYIAEKLGFICVFCYVQFHCIGSMRIRYISNMRVYINYQFCSRWALVLKFKLMSILNFVFVFHKIYLFSLGFFFYSKRQVIICILYTYCDITPWFNIQKYFWSHKNLVHNDWMILFIVKCHLFMYVYFIFWKDMVRTITLWSYFKVHTKCSGFELIFLFKKANFVVTLCICRTRLCQLAVSYGGVSSLLQ